MKKVALITGGSRGIGLGIAKCLAKEGWSLAINGVRSAEEVNLQVLKDYGIQVQYCQGNVALSDDRLKIWRKIEETFGYVNVLVNNAGVAPQTRDDLLDLTEESYDRVMKINLKGPFFLTQLIAKEMINARQNSPDFPAAIVNISSISATLASVNRGQYCISKSGMGMMTKLFAIRLGEVGIPVYEVRPGVIYTDMTSAVKEKYDDLLSAGLCLTPKWGQPEDVGNAVAALVRGDFSYSTGQVFMVDGGLTVPRL